MWPFKKKQNKKTVTQVETVLCIPGNWKDESEFVVALAKASDGILIGAGMIIVIVGEDSHVEFSFLSQDEGITKSFSYGGKVNGVSVDFLSEIDRHSGLVYIKSKGGTIASVRQIARVASAILDSGGMGVLVENAGIAFEPGHWQEFEKKGGLVELMSLFVVQSIFESGAQKTYSCGMHNFGLADASVVGVDFQIAVQVLRMFNFYRLAESPVMVTNQTFTPFPDSPKYRLHFRTRVKAAPGDHYWNPFGEWLLTAD